MSVRCLTWAFEQPLAGNEKVVLLSLADYARDDGVCWPGHETIAAKAYVSPKTVQRILAKLEEGGYITRTRRTREDGSRCSDLIALTVTVSRGATGQNGRTLHDTHVQAEPSEEPSEVLSGGAGAEQTSLLPDQPKPPPKAKPVTYRGKTVPKEKVALGEALLSAFNEAFGRDLKPRNGGGEASGHLKQICGVLLDRDEVTAEAWFTAVRNTAANPPGWAEDRQVQIGDVFGGKATDHALANTGTPPARKNGRSDRNAGILDLARRASAGEFGD